MPSTVTSAAAGIGNATTTLLAQGDQGGGSGSESINSSLQNAGNILQNTGVILLGLVLLAVFLIIGLSALGRGGNIRDNIGKIAIVLLAAFGMGIGGVLIGWFISLGGEVSA